VPQPPAAAPDTQRLFDEAKGLAGEARRLFDESREISISDALDLRTEAKNLERKVQVLASKEPSMIEQDEVQGFFNEKQRLETKLQNLKEKVRRLESEAGRITEEAGSWLVQKQQLAQQTKAELDLAGGSVRLVRTNVGTAQAYARMVQERAESVQRTVTEAEERRREAVAAAETRRREAAAAAEARMREAAAAAEAVRMRETAAEAARMRDVATSIDESAQNITERKNVADVQEFAIQTRRFAIQMQVFARQTQRFAIEADLLENAVARLEAAADAQKVIKEVETIAGTARALAAMLMRTYGLF
jgi:hypothetical protein